MGRGLSVRNVGSGLTGKTEAKIAHEALIAIAQTDAERGVTVDRPLDGKNTPLPSMGRRASRPSSKGSFARLNAPAWRRKHVP